MNDFEKFDEARRALGKEIAEALLVPLLKLLNRFIFALTDAIRFMKRFLRSLLK